jgi:hypothetical protein
MWIAAMLMDGAILAPAYADPPASMPATAPSDRKVEASVDQPATQPTTQPNEPVLAGGKSIGPYDRPVAQPRGPAFVSPRPTPGNTTADKPAKVHVGTVVGQSEGQYQPNVSVTTQPVNVPPAKPTAPK